MNKNTLRVIGTAVVGLLIMAGCGDGAGSPAGTGETAAASPAPTSAPTASMAPPSQTLEPRPTPTPIDTTAWVPFSSDRYGYDIAYPPTWAADAATRDWSRDLDRGQSVNPGVDHFVGGPDGDQTGVTVFSAAVPAAMSNDDWIAAYIPPDRSPSCATTDTWDAVTVGGQPAVLEPTACGDDQAYVFIGERVYVFSIWRTEQVPLLRAFLSSVRFHPDVVPGASSTP